MKSEEAAASGAGHGVPEFSTIYLSYILIFEMNELMCSKLKLKIKLGGGATRL